MDTLLASLFVGAVIVVLIAWWWHFHFWSNSPSARRSQSPLWLGFSTTAASALFLVAGIIGFKLDKHSRFVTGTAWTNGVIWWEIVVGLGTAAFSGAFEAGQRTSLTRLMEHNGPIGIPTSVA